MATKLTQTQKRNIASEIIASDTNFKSNECPSTTHVALNKISSAKINQFSHLLASVFNKYAKKMKFTKLINADKKQYKLTMEQFYSTNCIKIYMERGKSHAIYVSLDVLIQLGYTKVYHEKSTTKPTTTSNQPLKPKSTPKSKSKPKSKTKPKSKPKPKSTPKSKQMKKRTFKKSSQASLIQSLTLQHDNNNFVTEEDLTNMARIFRRCLNFGHSEDASIVITPNSPKSAINAIKSNIENDEKLKEIIKKIITKNNKEELGKIVFELCAMIKLNNTSGPTPKRQRRE